MTTTLRRVLAALTLTLAASVAAVSPASSAVAPVIPALTAIRTGVHPGYDRIVLDLTAGPAPAVGYRLADDLFADPSGRLVWLTGQFFVAVTVKPAAAHDAGGQPTYPGPEQFRTYALRNVMAVAVTGDFEGTLSIGLGVRSRTAVHVFTLTAPNRVVIDVDQ